MTKAESGRSSCTRSPIPPAEFGQYIDAVIRPLCAEQEPDAGARDGYAGGNCVPLLDKLRINQIVFNLLSNAVKYTPEGGTITYRRPPERLDDGRLDADRVATTASA
jgi:K+-sensing histidine kinase KdpD